MTSRDTIFLICTGISVGLGYQGSIGLDEAAKLKLKIISAASFIGFIAYMVVDK